jgi:uncharacterized membrane protein (UPF0127 family)
MKRKPLYIILGAVLVVGGLIGFLAWDNAPKLTFGSQHFRYELADTDAKRTQGLSGRSGLANDQAMLFVFDNDGPQCMWMKDMQFSLDMVWLNAAKQVVFIKQNISPDTYPQSFCADKPVRYVVEVNAGTVQTSGLQLGQTVSF